VEFTLVYLMSLAVTRRSSDRYSECNESQAFGCSCSYFAVFLFFSLRSVTL